ncbi:MAG: DUF5412 family protein [Sulfurospirillaceae bacterium]|nr:DUF5412 family protein [Sulfurospirillaceae bacterium]
MVILKKVLKIILGFFTVIIALVIGLITFIYFLDDDTSNMCGSEFIEQSSSPNGNLKAIIFQYDCGATTSFTTKVAIVNSNVNNYDKAIVKESVFSVDWNHDNRVPLNALNGGPEVRIKWLDNREVEIQYPALARVHFAKSFLFFKWLKVKYSTFYQ